MYKCSAKNINTSLIVECWHVFKELNIYRFAELSVLFLSTPTASETIVRRCHACYNVSRGDRNTGEDGPPERTDPAISKPSACTFPTTTSSQESQRKEGNSLGKEKRCNKDLCILGTLEIDTGIGIAWISMMQPPLFNLSKGRKTQRTSKAAEATPQRGSSNKAMAADAPRLKSQYGVDAWKRWIQWRQTQPNLEKPRFSCKSGYRVNTPYIMYQIWHYTSKTNSYFNLWLLWDSFFYLDCSTSHGVEGGCSSVHHCWAELWTLLLHQWS